jgi:hypothetical protein
VNPLVEQAIAAPIALVVLVVTLIGMHRLRMLIPGQRKKRKRR